MIGALGRDRLGIWSACGKREDSLETDDWARVRVRGARWSRIAVRPSGGGVLVWSLPDGERTGEHEASRRRAGSPSRRRLDAHHRRLRGADDVGR